MEKFTIDLDQLLNDFEYKELTDQYTSSSKGVLDGNHHQNQNIGKHSMNNVFRSLNEYVNTNIKAGTVDSIDNKSDKNAITKSASVSKDTFTDIEKEKSCNDLDIEGLDIVIPPLNDLVENVVSDKIVISKDPDKYIDECTDLISGSTLGSADQFVDGQIEKTDEKDCTVGSEGVLVNIEGIVIETKTEDKDKTEVKGNSSDKYDEKIGDNNNLLWDVEDAKVQSCGENVNNYLAADNKREELSEKASDDFLIESGAIRKVSLEGNIKEESIIDTSVEETYLDTKDEREESSKEISTDLSTELGAIRKVSIEENIREESTKDACVKEIIVVPEVEDTKEITLEFNSNKSIPNENISTAKTIQYESNFNEEIIVPSDIVVKFHELNLDDTEINKLLDELEDDEEINVEEYEQGNIIDSENKDYIQECSPPVNNNVNKEIYEENIEVESQKDHEEPTKEYKEELLLPSNGENLATNSNSTTDCQQEKKANQEDNLEFIDCDNTDINEDDSSEATVEEIVSEIIKNVIDNDRDQESSRAQENVQNADTDFENGKPIEKESSQDSLSRPQNLSLKGEVDESKRNIDLIGEPGSTPFNNVYVDKEIARVLESDSDSTTSSSPTFSDGSNTASTASTEEIQDEKEVTTKPAELDSSASFVTPRTEDNDQLLTDAYVGGSGDSNQHNVIQETSEPILAKNTPSSSLNERHWLGKEAPLWIPDSDAMSCLHCDMKFTVLKRRHHCRACGLVLCSKCCYLRFRLEYLDGEGRVCNKCHDILNKDLNSCSSSDLSPEVGNSPAHRPNPNNPSEYCSTVSPLQQVSGTSNNPPAVMVPVGVLKRKGSSKGKSNKSVMFCDGIRPGSDLTNLDNDFNYNNTKIKQLETANAPVVKMNSKRPPIDPSTETYIPHNENSLPPIVTIRDTDVMYSECNNTASAVERLKKEQVTFAIHMNLFIHLKIVDMSCCINKKAWCFSTEGLINVGQDEIVILLEYLEDENLVPKDVFFHLNNVYNEAVKGSSVKELGLSLHSSSNFLGCKNHAGFVYIRPTFQCLENIIKPKDPFLIGILIHRWETPWAKLFPLRLVLRLGAEYRYYPSPIISTRNRDSVFVEVGHTIINLLADFRNFSYTLPQIRGLIIHMEDKNTTVTIPSNRYDQVVKSLNNSSDHILAFAGNFSTQADSHLVCIQDTQSNENCYSTHAINIHNKPRKITGASFIVFSGALKSSSGLTAKSNIVEDGLMIQVLPEHMQQIRDNLRAMKDHTIPCGCINAATDETINIVWGENDVNFNTGVVSAIDNLSLAGIPSIRVHNGKNHVCSNASRVIRWTEVFIIQNGDDSPKNQDPIDISRVSETIAKATCDALVKHLDQLVMNNFHKIGLRTTLQADNVSYFAGSNGVKLPPIYMNSLDNELIPTLHKITSNLGDNTIVLELIFRILNI